jgi:hypothetical protein
MSKSVEFKDYSRVWLAVESQNLTNAIEAMADAIMKVAKVKAPKLNGPLRNSSHINRISPTSREIVFGGSGVNYAYYQERGYTSGPVRHYTTPGTQAHYLEETGDQISKQGIKAYKK